jgi:hypothetical protein
VGGGKKSNFVYLKFWFSFSNHHRRFSVLFCYLKPIFVISMCKRMTLYIRHACLVNRVNNRIAIRQRSNFHAAIDAAREHSTVLIELNLCHALTHVLEEAAVLVFAGVEEER